MGDMGECRLSIARGHANSRLVGRWQASLSRDPLGPHSHYLDRILATHWIRTLLINSYAFILLCLGRTEPGLMDIAGHICRIAKSCVTAKSGDDV